MEKRTNLFKTSTGHTALAALVLCAFLLRALIASGYMPAQPTAPGAGNSSGVMLCISGLPDTLVKAWGLTDDHPHSALMHCAFANVIGQAALLLAAVGLVLVMGCVGRPAACLIQASGFKPSSHGPPVGSRAPPLV